MNSSNRGALPPQFDARRVYEVVYPTTGQPLDVTILNPGWMGFYAHWEPPAEKGGKGRSRLCLAEIEACPHCGVLRDLWQAYLGVVSHTHGRIAIALLTTTAARGLEQLTSKLVGLRGLRVILRRNRSRATGQVSVETTDKRPVDPVPSELDIEPTIAALYGLRQLPSRLVAPVQEPPAEPPAE